MTGRRDGEVREALHQGLVLIEGQFSGGEHKSRRSVDVPGTDETTPDPRQVGLGRDASVEVVASFLASTDRPVRWTCDAFDAKE